MTIASRGRDRRPSIGSASQVDDMLLLDAIQRDVGGVATPLQRERIASAKRNGVDVGALREQFRHERETVSANGIHTKQNGDHVANHPQDNEIHQNGASKIGQIVRTAEETAELRRAWERNRARGSQVYERGLNGTSGSSENASAKGNGGSEGISVYIEDGVTLDGGMSVGYVVDFKEEKQGKRPKFGEPPVLKETYMTFQPGDPLGPLVPSVLQEVKDVAERPFVIDLASLVPERVSITIHMGDNNLAPCVKNIIGRISVTYGERPSLRER